MCEDVAEATATATATDDDCHVRQGLVCHHADKSVARCDRKTLLGLPRVGSWAIHFDRILGRSLAAVPPMTKMRLPTVAATAAIPAPLGPLALAVGIL